MRSLTTFITVIVSLTLLSLLSGCAEGPPTRYTEVKIAPAPEIIAAKGKAKLMPAGFLKRRLRLGFPSLEKIAVNDRQYMYITKKWFMDLVDWTEYYIKRQVPEIDTLPKLPTAYLDTFIMLTANIANHMVGRRHSIKASVLIGELQVKNVHPWGEIPGDGKIRVYMVCLTEDGLIIYDIPTRQIADSSSFPNLDSMLKVMF